MLAHGIYRLDGAKERWFWAIVSVHNVEQDRVLVLVFCVVGCVVLGFGVLKLSSVIKQKEI